MTETDKQKLVRSSSLACAAVVVETPEGDQSIGTAFHIGEGVYLTARHVLESNKILEIVPYSRGNLFKSELKTLVPTLASLNGDIPIWSLNHSNPALLEGPFFHNDSDVDVAAFKLSGIDKKYSIPSAWWAFRRLD
jgi:hypothetical protein